MRSLESLKAHSSALCAASHVESLDCGQQKRFCSLAYACNLNPCIIAGFSCCHRPGCSPCPAPCLFLSAADSGCTKEALITMRQLEHCRCSCTCVGVLRLESIIDFLWTFGSCVVLTNFRILASVVNLAIVYLIILAQASEGQTLRMWKREFHASVLQRQPVVG